MHLEPLANDGWQYIVQHTVSLPLPPLPLPKNPNPQVDHGISPVQSSHASKRIKHDVPKPEKYKGKGLATPSQSSKESYESVSSRLHLKDDCSHIISAVQPQGFNQPKVATERLKEDSSQRRLNASHSKYGF
jgi:hypothetical protein